VLGIAFALAAGGASADDPKEYDPSAVSAALGQAPGARTEKPAATIEVPPLPPRKKGVVLEADFGAMGFVGKLRTISPTASRLHLQLGYEPLRWVMVFGEGDLAFTSTRYSPPSRGYSLYGFGAGLRLTAAVSSRVSLYAQGDAGLMRASTDVLHSYGFNDAESSNVYFGGGAGVEWYQVNPHYALALSGGARLTPGLARALASDTAIAWLASGAIRYTF
jgi:hypothetical protein